MSADNGVVKDICFNRGIERSAYPEYAPFLDTVVQVGNVLDQIGLPRKDWFVTAGGSVTLRQLDQKIIDRKPTDADIIIWHSDPKDGYEKLQQIYAALHASTGFGGIEFLTDPREHHGYRFTNPIVQTDFNEFPVDFLTTMITVFPQCATVPLLANRAYSYPTNQRVLFDYTDHVIVDGQKVHVAHPAFTGFYKVTMNRNGNGLCAYGGQTQVGVPKQDTHDLCRLYQLGLLDPHYPGSAEVWNALTYDNPILKEEIVAKLEEKLHR
ncbi:hypothetical protein COU89_00375 [Candidatus Roizmanbacteria bacterium CG10_big_fil_rev_8_21_14_0_10_45_7]|uniref:Uncharacterized protein n=1 Tax=Candidatus Roizmanbacteria bacterium CG10_big_fil_rev_8_21_14_0_10_45_7 TaxID=1974854 RepID=A0A2M8KVU1_9BACT|nr:MAG: hypothetical protein COU89_00375 [Candidatus Roizmanbacteria bacterium CG10_big_fil_rev_8_21_14_0_10_45_7]